MPDGFRVGGYVPTVHCGKCQKDLEYGVNLKRKHHKGAEGEDRYIEVTCHGEQTRIAFASEPNERVEVWPSTSSADSASSSSVPPPTTK